MRYEMEESRSYCKRLGDANNTLRRLDDLVSAGMKVYEFRLHGQGYDEDSSRLLNHIFIEMSWVLNEELGLIAEDRERDENKAILEGTISAIDDDYDGDELACLESMI